MTDPTDTTSQIDTAEVTTYAPGGSGRRAHGFGIDGHRIMVTPRIEGEGEDDTEDAFRVACWLSRIAATEAALLARVEEAKSEICALQDKLPPERPANLLGDGCVRQRDGSLYLINRADDGFGEWGIRLDGWDDLFRRYDVRVNSPETDDHGQYWVVSPREAVQS